jgi:DNA-binding GntR family transcriptional regulator
MTGAVMKEAAMKGMEIRLSPACLHQQVTEDLLARIQTGRFQPGDPIPPEIELCREYGVSRITVRRAMAELVARRLVVRRRGIGTFVTGRPADRREFHLVGFLDEIQAHDHKIISNTVIRADGRLAPSLSIEPGSPVRHIRTVVHRDGEPFTIADAYTADLPGRRVSEEDVVPRIPMAQKMGERLGRRIIRAEQELDALPADAAAAKHLGIRRGTPLIRARRVYYSADDTPIQYVVVRYHPDRYRFIIDLVQRSGVTAFQRLPDMASNRLQEQEP